MTVQYGETGNPRHPYHCEYGRDTYYPTADSLTDEKMRAMANDAHDGLAAFHAFCAAVAIQRNNCRLMALWNDLNKALDQAGWYGLGGGRNMPWPKSIFNPDREAA